LNELEPDPLAPTPAEVERYVTALRETGDGERAWNQVRLAGVRAGSRPAEALRTLELLFRLGSAPDPRGETRGAWLTPALPAVAQSMARAVTRAWMPWRGKRFEEAHGENLVTSAARLPIKALWPSHRPRPLGDGRLAVFGFETRTAPSELDPGRQVLKIDYDHDGNPSFFVRDVLDELVEVAPGAYLGRMLVRGRRGSPYRLAGWFALRKPG
jgi:hypothetical protein